MALEHRLDVRRLLGGQPFVQVQHALHQADHTVVVRDVGGVGEVDGADPLDVHRWLLGFDEELAGAADAEAVDELGGWRRVRDG